MRGPTVRGPWASCGCAGCEVPDKWATATLATLHNTHTLDTPPRDAQRIEAPTLSAHRGGHFNAVVVAAGDESGGHNRRERRGLLGGEVVPAVVIGAVNPDDAYLG